jgi:iron complex outermembrane recepter protein
MELLSPKAASRGALPAHHPSETPMTHFRLRATSLAALAATALSAQAQPTAPTEPTDTAQPRAAAPATPTPPAAAESKPTKLDRVEITGSSIKRIAAETALPVQVINAEQIKRSGATTVAEVIQKLPAMQGFQVADTAIGSNSGGIASASLHDIGPSYTLVLLNGRRVAPTGSGSTINLNAIPMNAIERIEVLTDGASALYGADAIAGVVNFVLKRNYRGASIDVQTDIPLEGGGRSANASITYGFGDLEKDQFNLVTTFRRDRQHQLRSGDREFAKTAYVPVEQNGKSYIYDRTSNSAIPANATVTFKQLTGEQSTLPSYSFNPYQKKEGACAPNNFYNLSNKASVAENCSFDFVSTIDIFPEATRDALFLSGQFKATDSLKFFSDIAFSRLDLTARIAANPVPVAINTNSSYFTTYIEPYLTQQQLNHVDTVEANYRTVDFGTRNSRTITDAKHVVLGAEAELGTWSLNSAFTWSQNAIDERYVGGYFKKANFTDMVTSGAIDPFVVGGSQSAQTQQLIADAIYNGSVRTASTTLTGVDLRASSDIFTLPAGTVSLGLGGDLRNYHYEQTPDTRALNGEIYNYAAVPSYDLERKNAGLFAEALVPVIENFDVTGAIRHDIISGIKNGLTQSHVGSRMEASTAKLSARYQASSSLLFRGSYGTGFKAPDMLDIAQPLVTNGVTAATYDCPFPGTAACKPGKTQYSQFSTGNPELKPEKSRQATFGIRLEPTAQFGIGADYWQVEIRDAVSAISADRAFSDPAAYASLFTTYRAPAETKLNWAFINKSTNIGQSVSKGIDWDVIARFHTEFGRLTTGLTGTYLIKSSYTRAGSNNEFTDSLGHYGENAAVSFRNIVRATATLETGDVSNTLTIKARSGYNDKLQTVRDLSTGQNTKITLRVPHYATLDWQGKYKYSKALELRAGVKNILNKEPPLTLRDSSGHQVGYDPRYADPLLRTVSLSATYNF